MSGIYGVDVSNYQPINFALTTPGDGHPVDFAIIKVTEGTGYLNPRYTGQRQWARDHGLAVGYYHFGRPGSMVAQADYFMSKLSLAPGESLWFDWEDAGITSAQKDQWIKYVQGKLPGYRVGLYCNTSFWKSRDTSSFAGDGLWIATGGYPAGSPPVQSSWLIHQYSTAGEYDHDLAQFASRADMLDWAGGDMALSADDKTWLTNLVKTNTQATSLVDNKTHGLGYFAAKGEKALVDVTAQAKANGNSLTALSLALTAANTKLDTVASVLGQLDLSQLPAEIAAKLESLRLVVSVQEGN
jgi:hypothetical protein